MMGTPASTIFIAYPITAAICCIYLYKVYGIEKVENLNKIVCTVTAISLFISGVFCKDGNGERMPFLLVMFGVAYLLYIGFGFTRRSYDQSMENMNLRTKLSFAYTKETSLGYFLCLLYLIAAIGIFGSFAILAIISYILTGDVNTLARGR